MKRSSGALRNLVTQFADPFDAIRELVQNSIDADSSQIEVACNYEYTDKEGVISIHIDDYGSGMDEHIIDHALTKLFASSKENDLRKIGKFGIGFVSIFALKPKGVLLLTGRGGEYWEVFFHADQTFTKTRVDHPVEGTQITIFLEGSPAYYEDVVNEVRRSLKKWCVFTETEITFEDRAQVPSKLERINEPFGVEGMCPRTDRHPNGTEIAVAVSDSPVYGFYNRGLTLAITSKTDVFPERLRSTLASISVHVSSRYLEHTLSRDSVMTDAHFFKAISALEISLQKLHASVFARLTELAEQSELHPIEAREYGFLLQQVSTFDEETLNLFVDMDFIRCIVGPPLSPKKLLQQFRKTRQFLYSDAPSSLIHHAHEKGMSTIWISFQYAERQIRAIQRMVNISVSFSIWARLQQAFYITRIEVRHNDFQHIKGLFYDVEIQKTQPREGLLLSKTEAMLKEGYLRPIELDLVEVQSTKYIDNPAVFLSSRTRTLEQFGLKPLSPEVQLRDNVAYLNARNPYVKDVFEFAKQDVELAAFFLTNLIITELFPTEKNPFLNEEGI